MGAPTVHVLEPLTPRAMAALAESFTLAPGPEGAAGLVTVPGPPVGAALFDRAGPGLQVVAHHAVGLDNVDLAEAAARGIVVANTPDVLTRATAELAIGLLLALRRRIAEGDRLVRSGAAWRWAPTFMLGRGLDGARLAVVGPGRIGRATAELAAAVGMEVELVGRGDDLGAALARAGAVSLHVPLTPATRHLIDEAALARMRPGAVLVNTSRGPVVDEAALERALRAGVIAGAALDVYEDEPRVRPGLLELPNVVLTPHLGSADEAARDAMGMLCVDALRAVLLEGRRPANAIG